MAILLSFRFLLVLAVLMVLLISAQSFSDFEPSEVKNICKFKRLAEVERECKPVLSVSSKMKLRNDKIYGIAKDLSFQNGDWVQEAGSAPLMPFDESDMPKNFSDIGSTLKLASFSLMGMNFDRQADDVLGICGILSIAITRNRTLSDMPQRWSPWFHTSPGYSDLTIIFEGLYVEEANGGDRLMCLLGTSVSPFSKSSVDPYEWSSKYNCKKNFQYSFEKDDRIMLILRYPQIFTLTSRAILGELRSLNKKSDPKYFDKVQISSQLSYDSKYHFVSEQLVSRACNPYSCHELPDNRIRVHKASQFCKVLQKFGYETFDIDVASECHDMKHCKNLGPFVHDWEITEGKNAMSNKFQLLITNLHCLPETNSPKTAKVSAVFRALSPSEARFYSGSRTGISGMTISAEGTWNSSTGNLCMVGCIGLENDADGCDSRICLYLPGTFSITQRNVLSGTISSIKETYVPLRFKKELRPLDIWNTYHDYSKSYLSYRFTRIEMLRAFMQKDNSYNLGMLITKIIHRFPGIEDDRNLTLLSSLSDELSFQVKALPHAIRNKTISKTFLSLEVLSLGHLFGRHWPFLREHTCQEEGKVPSFLAYDDQNILLNVSAQLTVTEKYFSHVAKVFLEGLYDASRGVMHTVGCREIHSQKFMDCLIEVKVQYSSKTTRWLINPTASVSITSLRNPEDQFYFSPINLKTVLIPYRDNSKEVKFRLNFEACFRIFVLLTSAACLLSQLYYVEQNIDATPLISAVMLGIQLLGYGVPLVMDTPILFAWKEYLYPQSRLLHTGSTNKQFQFMMKLLLLIIFVLTLKLFQKVWDSRKITPKSLSLNHRPNDKKVLLFASMIHVTGFALFNVCHSMLAGETELVTQLNKYWGMIQDCFLLPQIIGLMECKFKTKPLSKVYYIGFTVVRFVLRGYDYLRDPVFDVYFHTEDRAVSSQFLSKFENVGMMMILSFLAIIYHIQQKNFKTSI
ncbi:hypothetical protein KY290_010375 [Solanum tuberosum]|uniref:RING-type E3 ubiquitin transferase n=1 Tax=Solanum tuberosum TaxID=4113 RepID=A0ABQ7VXL7_SOLTU|nr:hypothetical protein KY284_010287 [Solanum tuberosum]KAH0773238.1 hypothetical protein KY290_010375 [Solanum tuberosum]